MARRPELQGFQVDSVIEQLPANAQVYVVGGAVRDALMGRTSSDRDWVVVGATVDNMLAAGFTPVGSDFPVFLHPLSKEEYALARTERKSGHGYKGFTFHADPSVTLEEDLVRRDFTVNAMAMNAAGELIDPYGGLEDLQNKIMRHVSPAFAEDPLRVLRLARFLARFLDFSVAEETMALGRELRDSGELKHLVAERIFAELNKGMGEEKPSRMIKLITKLNAWSEFAGSCTVPFSGFDKAEFDQLNSLNMAEDRWVYALGFFLGALQIKALAKAWRMPRETEDLATLASNFLGFLKGGQFDSAGFGQFFTQVDLYRKPARLLRINNLLAKLPGGSKPVHAFVQLAVAELEQGHYKTFLGDKIISAQPGEPVPQVAANARQAWVNELHSKHF
jgi:tRNA nucleotidyltransferase (CCA-adding enzyme)